MKWETMCYTPPPLLSFFYGPAFTYLCIISHHCNASESNFKKKCRYPGHFDSPKVFKLRKFTLFCICNKYWGVGQYGVIEMMISLAAIWLVRNFGIIDTSELWIEFTKHISLSKTYPMLITSQMNEWVTILVIQHHINFKECRRQWCKRRNNFWVFFLRQTKDQ